MTPTLDALRSLYPHLSFTIYAYVRQPVTLEAITAEGRTFTFTADSEAAAILKGFPELFAPAPPAPEPTAPAPNVFD